MRRLGCGCAGLVGLALLWAAAYVVGVTDTAPPLRDAAGLLAPSPTPRVVVVGTPPR